jgi:hypothetical protein
VIVGAVYEAVHKLAGGATPLLSEEEWTRHQEKVASPLMERTGSTREPDRAKH